MNQSSSSATPLQNTRLVVSNGNCSRKLNLFGEGGEEGDMTCDLHHAFMTFVITFCYRSHDFCDDIVTGHMTHFFLICEGKISEH